MKRLIMICMLLAGLGSLWAQKTDTFPSARAAGNLYLGTDTYAYYDFRNNQHNLSGKLSLAGQYFVNEDLAVGASETSIL